ncbi:MAG TPA: hypothetical protein VF331_15165 [Polyangiales bacterium]
MSGQRGHDASEGVKQAARAGAAPAWPRQAPWRASPVGLAALLLLASCSLDRAPSHAGFQTKGLGVSGAGAAGGTSGAGGLGHPNAGNSAIGNAGAFGAGSGGAGAAGGGVSGSTGGSGVGGTAGTAGSAGTGGMPVRCASATSKAGKCKITAEGIYAMKSELDVWWMDEVNPSQPLTDPGRGKLTIYFMAEITNMCTDGSDGLTTLHTCGNRLPPLLVDVVCKVIQIEFPDEMWDGPHMPRFSAHSTLSGFNPGDILSLEKVSSLLGIELTAPDAAWPSYKDTGSFPCTTGTGAGCFPDEDGDGQPGVTVHINPGGTYTGVTPYACGSGAAWQKSSAPLGLTEAAFNLAGAQTAYIGLRLVLGGESKLSSDCLSGVGGGSSSANIPSRSIGCVRDDGMACTIAQQQFLDQNVPNFHLLQVGETPPPAPTWQHPRENPVLPGVPKVTLDRSTSLGPRTSVVRIGNVGDPLLCADVRGANFPAFE